MAVVETKSLRKEFGHTIAVDGIDLEPARVSTSSCSARPGAARQPCCG